MIPFPTFPFKSTCNVSLYYSSLWSLFYFPCFGTDSRLYTHIWRLGAGNSKWDRPSNIFFLVPCYLKWQDLSYLQLFTCKFYDFIFHYNSIPLCLYITFHYLVIRSSTFQVMLIEQQWTWLRKCLWNGMVRSPLACSGFNFYDCNFWGSVSLCSLIFPKVHYKGKAGFELTESLLSLFSEFWDYRLILPQLFACLLCAFWRSTLGPDA